MTRVKIALFKIQRDIESYACSGLVYLGKLDTEKIRNLNCEDLKNVTIQREQILEHWNDDNVQSMYDKHLIALEISQIKKLIKPGSIILDAGCGEGEGTLEYAEVEAVKIVAADFSETRLNKARARLRNCQNVELRRTDFLSEVQFHEKFDLIITQRFLINLIDWQNQKNTIKKLINMLAPEGTLIFLEGSEDGVRELNNIRERFDLKPIAIPWHNSFFKDEVLESFMQNEGFVLQMKNGLGSYYLLTRAIRPYFDRSLNWDAEFNQISASLDQAGILSIGSEFSRTKLWHFKMDR